MVTLPNAPLANEKSEGILIIEDNPADAYLIRHILHTGRESESPIYQCDTLSRAVDLIYEKDPKVAILDLGLPDVDELNGLQEINTRFPYLPIVVLTSSADLTLAVRALDLGAQEYLVKDNLNEQILSQAIRYAQERVRNKQTLIDNERRHADLKLQIEGERFFRQLFTDVHHEMRTPLAVIKASADLIKQVKTEEMIEKKHAAIEESVARLSKISDYIAKLAYLSSVTPEQNENSRSQEIKLLIYQLTSKVQSLRLLTFPDEPFELKIPINDLSEILFAVLENGEAYAPVDTPLTIQVEFDPEHRFIVFKVEDRGAGIEPNELPRIFLPFHRSDSARSAGEKGHIHLGLGLSLAQSIAITYGGRIEVESCLGQGSRFSVSLPLK